MKTRRLRSLQHVRRHRLSKYVRKKLRMLQKQYARQQVKIFTKIGIVYERANERYEVLPYFDSRKKYQIWGVCLKGNHHDIMLGKDDFGKNAHVIRNENQFYILSLNAFIKGGRLPHGEDVALILKYKDEVNNLITLMQSYGVQADKLMGAYVMHSDNTSYEAKPENKMIVFYVDGDKAGQCFEIACQERYPTRLIK